MPITIIPRRSVKIEAWNATHNDLLRVVMSDRTVYYARAAAVDIAAEPYFWFDYEFMSDEVKQFAREVIRADIRFLEGDAIREPGTASRRISTEEVDEELRSRCEGFRIEKLDYDLTLTVNYYYALSELRQWHNYNRVVRVEPTTRQQVRAEMAGN